MVVRKIYISKEDQTTFEHYLKQLCERNSIIEYVFVGNGFCDLDKTEYSIYEVFFRNQLAEYIFLAIEKKHFKFKMNYEQYIGV